jgi:hypothetical protein
MIGEQHDEPIFSVLGEQVYQQLCQQRLKPIVLTSLREQPDDPTVSVFRRAARRADRLGF